MAIDRTGISSLQTGAPEIKYTGDQGPKSPEQERQMAFDDTPTFELQPLELLLEEFREDNNGQDPTSIDDLRRFFYNKYGPKGIAKVEQAVQQSEQSQRMASADPMLEEQYQQYVFEMQEMGREPMSFEQFKQQAVAGMATGGIARLGLWNGGSPHQEAAPTSRSYGPPGSVSRQAAPAHQPAAPAPAQGGAAHHHAVDTPKQYADQQALNMQQMIAKQAAEKDDWVEQKDIGTGDYRDVDPVTGKRIITPPISGGEGLASMGPTPAELEAMRIRLLLQQQEAAKAAADEKVAAIKEQEEEDEFLASLTRDYDFEDLQYGDDRGLMYAAHGGRVPAAYGGLMGNDGRRAYGLGSFFKSVTKPFKKAAKTIKKVAKSPIGKLALGYLAGAGIAGIGQDQGWARFTPSNFMSNVGRFNPFSPKISPRSKTFSDFGISELEFAQKSIEEKDIILKRIKEQSGGSGAFSGLLKAAMVLGPAAALAYPKFGETPGLSMTDATAANQAAADAWAQTHLQGLDEEDWKLTPASGLTPLEFAAQGGRIGYAKGGNDDEELPHRTAALSAMYGLRKNAQEGGLMDLGGMEKDYREEGRFVPIGGQERADDVPARLSKNEFVFTADAVRSAGGGDIDAGAEVMENVMNNLEQGGKISEESQGLEGARNMFATAQRLEGVL